MKSMRLVILSLSILVLATGAAFADKQGELDALALKPWSLEDIGALSALADVSETEPNDACGAGNAYTLGDTFHGEITAGDEDWISFSCTAGDEITIGTDEDLGLGTVDTFIELWDDACGAMLASNDDGGPGLYSLIADFPAPYTGTYRLKIRGFSGTSAGFYTALGGCVTPPAPGFCPIGTYKGSKINVGAAIADTLGPVITPAIKFNDQNCVITDVIIDLNIEHTWVGDLVINLVHTSDGGVVTTVPLVDQPGVPESTFGCAGDLVSDPESKYYFSSRPDLAVLGQDDCPASFVPACYQSEGDLGALNGLFVGDGTFHLEITDNSAGDEGFVHNWSVHLQCDTPISVEENTWGGIKAIYR
ncbi:MAG: hypothetical protein DHS20C21_21440 [Gemmatimonadota bacterium]|nr:MAG: hypothetical protein DHS20C21_21440 [Gemmatimonadota bacterium]